MQGKPLAPTFNDFMTTIEDKRKNFFKLALSNNLENIHSENLTVTIDEFINDDEISPYNSECSDAEDNV